MALDSAKNFAKSTLSTGYTSAATSIVLTSGGGAKFPTVSFNAVWYNSTDYADPSDDPSVEVVRVTNIATDTLTVTRGQESTSAANHNTAGKTYTLIAGPTAKLLSDISSTYVTSSGANTYIPLFTSGTTLVNSMMIQNTNRIGIGVSPSTLFHIATDSTANGLVTLDQSYTDANGFDINLRKCRGTLGAPTTVAAADQLGTINFYGYGGGYVQSAMIQCLANGTPGSTRVGSQLSFWVGTDAAPTVLQEGLRLIADGAGTNKLFTMCNAAGTVSNFVQWNTDTSALAGTGMLMAAGSAYTSYIGGLGAVRIDAATNSVTALRVLSNGALTSMSATGVLYLQGGTTPTVGVNGNFGLNIAAPATVFAMGGDVNGGQAGIQTATELLTVAAAASSATVGNLLPAGAIVLAVTCRVTTVIPTATSFTLKSTTDNVVFTGAVSVAANSTSPGTTHWAATTSKLSTAAQTITLTITGSNPAANTGRVRITTYYYLPTAPTS